MKEMIKSMVQEMIAQSIKEVMAEMMGTSPVVASAEAVDVPTPKKSASMSKEEFLALEEPSEIAQKMPLDFDVVKVPCGRGFANVVKYNQYVPSDIWTINHLKITAEYGGKWSGKLHGYTFPDVSTLRVFLSRYHIKTELDATDRNNIKAYRVAKAQKEAENAAKKVAELSK